MSLRAPFRRIVVSEREFVWKLRANSLYADGDRHIVVCAHRRAGHLLIDPYPWELEITPATVAAAIQFAIAHGWDPDRRGTPMILGFRRDSFIVLPTGVRFSHELTAAELPLSPELVPATPSAKRLAETVRAFSPWLDNLDVENLSAAFSALLLEPGRFWQDFVRGNVTRDELRNALVARSQAILGKVFQASVSPDELEAALSSAFDRVLFQGAPEAPSLSGSAK